MKLARPVRLVVLLVLLIAASYAFGDPIYVTTHATTYIPPPSVLNLHAIDTLVVPTDSYWTPSDGFAIANANWQNSNVLAHVRFSERDRYHGRRHKRAPLTVPEPSGIELLSIGFIGVVFAVRKFRI